MHTHTRAEIFNSDFKRRVTSTVRKLYSSQYEMLYEAGKITYYI